MPMLRIRYWQRYSGAEANANKARTDLQDAQVRLVKVEQEANLVQEVLDTIRKQSVVSVEYADKSLQQLAVVFS